MGGDGPDVVTEGEKVNFFMVLCVVVVSVSSVLLGYDIGVMSGAVIFIREDFQLTGFFFFFFFFFSLSLPPYLQ